MFTSENKKYNWEDLYAFENEIKVHFEVLKDVVKSNEKIILDRKKIVSQNEIENYDDEKIVSELEATLRNSSLMSIMSIFENKLKELCVMIEIKIDSEIKHNQLRSDKGDIGKMRKYLKDIFKLDDTIFEKYYIEIYRHKNIRNIIVHHNGICGNGNNNAVKLKGIKIQGVMFNEFETFEGKLFSIIIIDDNFFIKIIRLLENYFRDLINEVDLKINFA